MKILFTLFIWVFVVTGTQAQILLGENSKQIFSSPQLSQQIRQHHTVAILPFSTKITYPLKFKNKIAAIKQEQEILLAQDLQRGLYAYLLRKAKTSTLTIQNVDITNQLLLNAGMYHRLQDYTTAEIAQVLRVDAVVGGWFERELTLPEETDFSEFLITGGKKGKSGLGTLILMIHSGHTGEMIWRFFKTMDDDFTADANQVVARMFRKVTRNFPYAI